MGVMMRVCIHGGTHAGVVKRCNSRAKKGELGFGIDGRSGLQVVVSS